MNWRILTRQGWTVWHAIGALVFTCAAIALTATPWSDILLIATKDEEQSHIFLVPVVACWMFWARKIRFRSCPPGGAIMGTAIVGLSWMFLLVGLYGLPGPVHSFLMTIGRPRIFHIFASAGEWLEQGNTTMVHCGTVGMAIGAALTFLGVNVLRQFFPAFAVLVFIVPIPGAVRQFVSLPLQTAAAASTQALLETFGVLVERSANQLTINGNDVMVAEACNGMRMVFALVLVSYAFAFGIPLRNSVRLVVLALSPVAALVCNVFRLIPTVLIFGQAEKTFMGRSVKDLASSFHDVSGWLMVPLAFLLLLAGLKALRWALIPVTRYTLAYQ
jgi:exosortase